MITLILSSFLATLGAVVLLIAFILATILLFFGGLIGSAIFGLLKLITKITLCIGSFLFLIGLIIIIL